MAPVLSQWFNSQFGRMGRMINLQIDSKRKSIHLELELKGEAERIQIQIPSYEVVQEGETTYVELGEIRVSREWMNALAQKYLKNQRFEVPSALKIAL
jgi:hypothetical protein